MSTYHSAIQTVFTVRISRQQALLYHGSDRRVYSSLVPIKLRDICMISFGKDGLFIISVFHRRVDIHKQYAFAASDELLLNVLW
jgi:hypothetical protein